MPSSPLEEINHVIDGVWISSLLGAEDTNRLNELGIQSVLSVGCSVTCPTSDIKYVSYPSLLDKPEESLGPLISSMLPSICADMIAGRKVLIHCVYGQSRSASLILAYLIIVKRYEFEESLTLLKDSRPSLCINPGFLCQLYYISLHLKSAPSLRLLGLDLSGLPNVVDEGFDDEGTGNETIEFESSSYTNRIVCNNIRCKTVLASSDEIIPKDIDCGHLLDTHLDSFWKGYVPIHPGLPKKWISRLPLDGHVAVAPSSWMIKQVESDGVGAKRKRAESSSSAQSSSSQSSTSTWRPLSCPCCRSEVGWYKRRGLGLCNNFLVVDLFALSVD